MDRVGREGELTMRKEPTSQTSDRQAKESATGFRRRRIREEGEPFVGASSEKVGRGSGQDPQDELGEEREECDTLHKMQTMEKIQSGRMVARASEGLEGQIPDAASIQRPPSDS